MGDVNSEPSMEEILSSIKKIIAEDNGKPLVVPKRHVPSDRRAADLVIEPLADPVPAAKQAPVASTRVEPVSAESSVPDADDVLELTENAPEAGMSNPGEAEGQIISQATAGASREALVSLSRLVVKPDVVGSDTLEGMVRDMLKPMLKDWLDAKLPEIVERVVAQEVGRISGRVL